MVDDVPLRLCLAHDVLVQGVQRDVFVLLFAGRHEAAQKAQALKLNAPRADPLDLDRRAVEVETDSLARYSPHGLTPGRRYHDQVGAVPSANWPGTVHVSEPSAPMLTW